jgi:hypothetical protein
MDQKQLKIVSPYAMWRVDLVCARVCACVRGGEIGHIDMQQKLLRTFFSHQLS